MDIAFTKEDQAFREEIRQFLRENVPAEARRKMIEGYGLTKEESVSWWRTLNRKGWAVPHWPREYGGTGWSAIQQFIFLEEMESYPMPRPIDFGAGMVGPVIYTFGTEEQKQRYLPRIRNLDDWWCQGFSEPGSGSDLASLRTKAERRGDKWIINGQKTWTTFGQHADMIFCLCRTDGSVKKQKGISFIVFPMTTKGVTLRPIQLLDGGYEVNDVFLDNVEVPIENLIGEENKGWDYAKFLLSNERVGTANVGQSKQRLRRIKEVAARTEAGGGLLIEDMAFREKLAAFEIQLKALEITQLRVISEDSEQRAGRPNPASSMLKLRGSELQQAATELLVEVVGPFVAPFEMRGHSDSDDGLNWFSRVASNYFNNRKVSIYGGSNEIQRNIIAKVVLGL